MENGINKISVYGDSILKGVITGTGSGHLFDLIEDDSLTLASRKLGFALNNQSVFGNIITKAAKKLSRDIARGSVGDLAIIESGGNDCDYDWPAVLKGETTQPRVPLEQFIDTIDQMVRLCRANSITPLLMTMPPLVSDWWYHHICEGYGEDNVRAFVKGDTNLLYQNHEMYNMRIVRFCVENGVQFVDMRQRMLESGRFRQMMCADGIHPTLEGYRFMADVWEEVLPRVVKEGRTAMAC